MNVYDNFLDPNEFANLFNYFHSDEVEWNYVDHVVYPGDGHQFYCNVCYSNLRVLNQDMFKALSPIISKIDPLALFRIKSNLSHKEDPSKIEIESQYHTDEDSYCIPGAEMKTGIYYVTTNNGATIFRDGTRVDSVANRLLTFPCHMSHAPIPHTDDSGNRIVINFNYFYSRKGL